MRVAICQPTYLPWLGYFDLIDQVDAFVLLDTVQFDKRSWQQRNRVKTPHGLEWLTVPVVSRGRYDQKIRDVEILDTGFVRTHLRTIEVNYSPAPYFRPFFSDFSSILSKIESGTRLGQMNFRLLEWLVARIGIRTPLLLASSLNEVGKRTELLANICRQLGASQYLSPIGSAGYLLEDLSVMSEAGIETFFHHYIHPEYGQRFPPFVPFASVIDLILNEGDRALDIIRSGRRTSLTSEELAAKTAEVEGA